MRSANDKVTDGLEQTERLLFCKALKMYETKEFKKGIKTCNTILSTVKGANHAETMALKGVLMSCTGLQDEGYHLCKLGISKDLNSYMCWHILGVVERDRRNYASSLACFRTAVKRNPDNIQILRDLSNLQLHQGDYLGNMETREKLYNLQPSQITNTIGYAYGCFLCKNYQTSYEILENAEKVHVTFHSQLTPQELNNILLFKIELMCYLSRFEEIDEFVRLNEDKLLDKENLLKLIAKAHQLNSKYDLAAEKYLQLLLLMPNQEEYADKYVENFELIHSSKQNAADGELLSNDNNHQSQIDEEDELIKRHSHMVIYKSLLEYIPHSMLLKQRYMLYAPLDEFEAIIDDYLKVSLDKNIPQAITTLRHIYDSDFEGKIDLIQEKLIQLVDQHTSANNTSTLQWCHYYLASHYRLIDSFDQALVHLKECLLLNKSMNDAIVLIAKIYRCIDNFDCANRVMKYICDLVPTDRYMNSITGKYFFYVNNVELADKYLQRFSRSNQGIDSCMREVQNLWYRIHKASLFFREKKYYHALYHGRLAECDFEQFTFDKIDFHYYCIRHLYLKAHENLLRQDASLRCSKFHWRLVRINAKTLIGIYRDVVDSIADKQQQQHSNNNSSSNAAGGHGSSQPNSSGAQVSAAKQKKQERLKKLKEMKKENRQNGGGASEDVSSSNHTVANKKPVVCCPKKHVDNTPDKLKLFYTDPSNLNAIVNELNHFASLLQQNFNYKFKTQSTLFEIYHTVENPEKLFNTYQQMVSIQPNHFKLFWYEYRMLKYFVEIADSLDATIKANILSYLPISDLKDSKFHTYISLKLSDYIKKYHQNPWNMVTYILVATNLNLPNLIEPTANTLFDLLENEPDVFSYTEITKFRKFIRKYLPDRTETLDRLILNVFPAIFDDKHSIDYLD